MFPSTLLVLAAAAAPAFGALYMTSPVASTSWAAGQPQTISWQDDGTSPSLSQYGNISVAVYVGSSTQQTQVQSIVDSVDAATTSSIQYTPDALTGENGAYYFIRIQSLTLMDASNTADPQEAFSAKYTMTGMTGTFTATELAQISAASEVVSSTTGGASTASSAPSTTTKAATTTSKASTAASGTGSAAASAANGASSVPVSALSCAGAIAVAFFTAMLL